MKRVSFTGDGLMRDDICPKCGSRDVEGDSLDMYDGNQIAQVVYCLECDCEWTNTYRLTGKYVIGETRSA